MTDEALFAAASPMHPTEPRTFGRRAGMTATMPSVSQRGTLQDARYPYVLFALRARAVLVLIRC